MDLPAPEECLLRELQWGRFDQPFTPAFWASMAWMNQTEMSTNHRLGDTILEELIACLLGGYGMRAELGIAAFQRVRKLLAHPQSSSLVKQSHLEKALSQPFLLNGKPVKYRFPLQKAHYLTEALRKLDSTVFDSLEDQAARNYLMTLRGVGFKTASWVVRNWRSSDQVAILDVHIVRLGKAIGLFSGNADPQRNYIELEQLFLEFSGALGVAASLLDAIIWDTMRNWRLPMHP